MPEYKAKQLSAEWLAIRRGKATGSNAPAIMKTLKVNTKNGAKGAPAAERRNYAKEVAGEILSGVAASHFVTRWMDEGREKEPAARDAYQVRTMQVVDLCGFFIHDVISRFGASPDGLIDDDGIVEFKCPKYETHIEYLLNPENLVEKYEWQCVAEMSCTGRQWVDLVSFFDKDEDGHTLPRELQMVIVRVNRDEAKIKELEDSVLTFLEEVEAILKVLAEKYGNFEPAHDPPSNPIAYDETMLGDDEFNDVFAEDAAYYAQRNAATKGEV